MNKYDFDFKISGVEAYKNGLNYKEIREKFHVTKTCFYDWLKLDQTIILLNQINMLRMLPRLF